MRDARRQGRASGPGGAVLGGGRRPRPRTVVRCFAPDGTFTRPARRTPGTTSCGRSTRSMMDRYVTTLHIPSQPRRSRWTPTPAPPPALRHRAGRAGARRPAAAGGLPVRRRYVATSTAAGCSRPATIRFMYNVPFEEMATSFADSRRIRHPGRTPTPTATTPRRCRPGRRTGTDRFRPGARWVASPARGQPGPPCRRARRRPTRRGAAGRRWTVIFLWASLSSPSHLDVHVVVDADDHAGLVLLEHRGLEVGVRHDLVAVLLGEHVGDDVLADRDLQGVVRAVDVEERLDALLGRVVAAGDLDVVGHDRAQGVEVALVHRPGVGVVEAGAAGAQDWRGSVLIWLSVLRRRGWSRRSRSRRRHWRGTRRLRRSQPESRAPAGGSGR